MADATDLHKNSIVSTRQDTGSGHATVERFCGRLRSRIQRYVFMQQETITYGAAGRVVEVEADDVTISRYPNGDCDKPMSWVSYVGMVERGNPALPKLIELQIRTTVLRAIGPGPITLDLWRPIARKVFSTGHDVCLRTDSAKTNGAKLPKVSRPAVARQ
eukprot:5226718-Amphidinium_carterae.1